MCTTAKASLFLVMLIRSLYIPAVDIATGDALLQRVHLVVE